MEDADTLIRSIHDAADLAALDQLRVAALGKAGSVTAKLKSLGAMDPATRAAEGPAIHALREAVTGAIAERKAALEAAELDRRLATERIDLSLPAADSAPGSVHPVSQVMDELAEIFADLGFAVAEGPEIEEQWYNFTALNMPEFHPARAMQDTFYAERIDGEPGAEPHVLRTHTSPVQIRAMTSGKPPFRLIAPGRVYRSDSDATHTPMFHQVEGLVIDRGITLGHLKWTLETFLKAFFERDDVVLRMRPSYFPFTEPSAEVDVGWSMEKGRRVVGGCEGWMEVLGSGMVHPRVIANCGLDPDEWQGFAFGTGVDRLAMLKYGMDDLRAFFDGDLRWLRHYGFRALDVPTLSGGVRGMKFSLSWLKAHLDTEANAQAIADKLTAIGLEVEEVVDPAAALAPFRIARVLSAEKHPQADKLQVLSVDAGDGPMQVVCGAPNARAGMIGVFGPPGAYVPGSAMTLKVAAIRGVTSNGMMCSVRELELGDEHDGIIELAADAPVGASFAEHAGLDDPVFDVAITPDRADCMGVRGIARDLAAAGVGSLKPLAVPAIEGSFASPIDIRIEDPEGCPAFFGRAVRGVRNGASPEWLQRRLKSAGQRPISAVVDITNYVMLDLGRPSHAYDQAKIDGALIARRARDGETITALNEKDYTLDPSMTVIADERQAHDIGGIMGGEHSGVAEGTTDLLLEVAYFAPDRIARTGQKLALSSDARTRFERGVDPGFLAAGLDILTGLILDICGGEASEALLVGEPPSDNLPIPFDPARTLKLGGIDVPEDRQRAILLGLGFTFDGASSVRAPSWRRDVDGPADLVEEVARIEGYDTVPSTPLDRIPGVARPTATRSQLAERRVRRAAAARGLDEAVTWSFIGEAEAAPFGPAWQVTNPISEDMKVMRPSLLPGLIAAARRNLHRGATSVRLFEVGRRYLAEGEHPTVSLILAGERRGRGWQSGKAQAFDPFDAKAEVLALLEAAGAPVANLQIFADAGPTWHPGRSAKLGLGPKTVLARFGEIHPSLARALDVPPGLIAADIYLDAIPAPRLAGGRARAQFTPPALQSVNRDFAFIVPAELAADQLVRAIRGADKQAITEARLFDRFETPDGLSLAVEVTLQPGDKSFTDEEIAAISRQVVAAAEKLGARLRG